MNYAATKRARMREHQKMERMEQKWSDLSKDKITDFFCIGPVPSLSPSVHISENIYPFPSL